MKGQIEVASLLSFAEVAGAGSFSAAARAVGRSRQSLHREVDTLEHRLGVQLFERSTRKLRTTDVGQRLLIHAEQIRSSARAATEVVRSARARPGGVLRVTAPELLGEVFVAPVMTDLVQRYPEVRVEATFTLERLDLLSEGFDVAIRAGQLADSSLLATPLGRATVVRCAAPGYLKRAPKLAQPTDLVRHATLHYGRDTPGVDVAWSLGRDTVRHRPRLASTSARAVCDAARRGLGVAQLPLLACAEHVEAGELIEVLPAWRDESAMIHALHASRAVTNPTLDAFVRLLRRAATKASWLHGRAVETTSP